MNTSNIDPVIEDIYGRFKTTGIKVDRNKIRDKLNHLVGYKVPLNESKQRPGRQVADRASEVKIFFIRQEIIPSVISFFYSNPGQSLPYVSCAHTKPINRFELTYMILDDHILILNPWFDRRR